MVLQRIKIQNQLEHERGRDVEAPLERKRKELAQVGVGWVGAVAAAGDNTESRE
jgi:hypothetical protein